MTTTFPLTWDLDRLNPRPDTPEFRENFDAFRQRISELAAKTIAEEGHPSEWLADRVREFEPLEREYEDLISFVECHAAADAENACFQQFEAELSAIAPVRERIVTSIEYALGELDDKSFEQLVASSDFLGEVQFYLEDRRRTARLRLPPDEQALAAQLAVDGLHAWGRLYDRLSGELRVTTMERGELIEKSPGQVSFDSPERSVRENNFMAASKAWDSIGDLCGEAINHIAGTRLTIYDRLGVDHLAAPLHLNRIERTTLEAMWSTITARKPELVRYLTYKARLMGLDQLSWFDLGAPLPSVRSDGESITYDVACRTIIDTFNAFNADFGRFAKSALENGWVEVEDRAGKRQGGFCTGFPVQRESRIFMTFTATPDSMSTLAHELGHAYHSHVLRDQSIFLSDYPMNLAETASTFAEAVLADERLRQASGEYEELQLLDQMLGDSVAFLMNIHSRFLFEDRFHQERSRGELSAGRLSEIMLAAQHDAYQGSLSDNGYYPGFWISKLHFYITTLPFYNFPYTFGYLLSLGVYALAREQGEAFHEAYVKLLLATGSQRAEDAVRSTLGYELQDEGFWHKSLDIVAERCDRFVALAESVLSSNDS